MNNFLAITYAFMLAFCPYDNIGIGEIEELNRNLTDVTIQIGIELFDSLKLYAEEETRQTAGVDLFNWRPYTQVYSLGAEYNKSFNDSFEFYTGVYHKCQHPVACWEKPKSEFNGAYTAFYIGIKGKVDIF